MLAVLVMDLILLPDVEKNGCSAYCVPQHLACHVPYNMENFLFVLGKMSGTKKQTEMSERTGLYFRGRTQL